MAIQVLLGYPKAVDVNVRRTFQQPSPDWPEDLKYKEASKALMKKERQKRAGDYCKPGSNRGSHIHVCSGNARSCSSLLGEVVPM